MNRLARLAAAAGVALSTCGAWAASAAEGPVCKGRDLLAEIAATDPARHAAILEDARTHENSKARFWRILPADGGAPSWLLGTMHVSDPRVTGLPAEIDRALDEARVVALENTTVLDPVTAMKAYGEGRQFVVFQDGRRLDAVVGPEVWAKFKVAMERRGLPAWAVIGWKPWVSVFGMLIYPPCEMQRWAAGRDFLDRVIGLRAQRAGKPVEDLESVMEQFAAIDAMPEADQVAMLAAIVAMDSKMEDLQETTLRAYLTGDVGLLWATSLALLEGSGAFQPSLMANAAERRNAKMFERAKPLVEGGHAFIAVGALHLIGERGLVRLFRDAGYRVEPVR